MHGIRLRPDSSLIELRGRLFNRTPLTQTFLWWANVAVKVHKDYQSFFPPDVHYVADHAVRAMSDFPFAENDYYGIPYHKRPGRNDLRHYENIPVPTSYMVCETKFNFFGGYDFKSEGGFIHVANRHIAPGKKQWTWGSEEFGKAWDRELCDNGDPYFELMAGVYTDNQPDFSYLLPYETKTFSQFWWSYKKIGPVQNANKDLAIRLVIQQGNKLDIGVASSRQFENLQFILKIDDQEQVFKKVSVSPEDPWIEKTIVVQAGQEKAVSLSIFNEQGKELLTYQHNEINKLQNRKLAKEPAQPTDVKSSNELELIGEHLELYRHPTHYPEPYWEEAIKRDSSNYKAHISLGRSGLKKGNFRKAKRHFQTAIEIQTNYHPNPASGEAHYFGGIAAMYLDEIDEAYALLYKSTWNYECRSAAYYRLAAIDCLHSDYEQALKHIEASLDTNRQNNKAFVLKAIIYKRLGKGENAKKILVSLMKTDPLDQWAKHVQTSLSRDYKKFLRSSRNDAQTIIDIAFDYCEAGFYEEAIQLIQLHHEHEPANCAVPNPLKKTVMTRFILAWLFQKVNKKTASKSLLKELSTSSYDYFFPSRTQEQLVLEWAIQQHESVSMAAYGLGNYYYNLKRHEDAINSWESSSKCRLQLWHIISESRHRLLEHNRQRRKGQKGFQKGGAAIFPRYAHIIRV